MADINVNLEKMKVPDLKELAKTLNIDISGKTRKEEIIEKILSESDTDTIRKNISGNDEGNRDEQNLEDLGEELAEIGTELEETVEKLEKMPPAEMADIPEINEKLDNASHIVIDYSKIGQKLDIGRVKFQDKQYMNSLKELDLLRGDFGKFNSDLEDVLYSFIILASEKVFEDCADAECRDEAALNILLDAKRAFSEKGPRRKEASDSLVKITTKIYDEQVARIKEKMENMKKSINTMKIQGVDVFNPERYIHRATESFASAELGQTMKYLKKANTLAEESRADWIRRIKENVPNVRQTIQMANELGADVSEAERFLDQASLALDNEDYALCAELTKASERKAMESQQSQIQKAAQLERRQLAEAQDILSSINSAVQEAQLYRLDTQYIDQKIQSARQALQSNDYVNAKIYAKEAENLVRTLNPQIEAERQRISGEPGLKLCTNCGQQSMKVFDNNLARCMSCGAMFEAKQKSEKKIFGGLFNK